LLEVLQALPVSSDPNLLVGFENYDDAAVYRVSDDIAVVSTVDFITPPVDDPLWFGRIAAANSLSDIYAMGGRPITALNLIMFPSAKLGAEILKDIIRGGGEKVAEAGASLAGGHSVEDDEPKYGLAVTGIVSPKRVLTNSGAKPGDLLILTKPLGTGVLFNAHKSGKLSWKELEPILPEVAALNKTALEVALKFEVHACTDVTGFGIMGHSLEMAKASSVGIELEFGALPFYSNSLEMYRKGETTGSNNSNFALVRDFLRISARISEEQRNLLFDPQTSGGLLISVPEPRAEALLQELTSAGVNSASLVGKVFDSRTLEIRLV
jgi:selenide,water dikinase